MMLSLTVSLYVNNCVFRVYNWLACTQSPGVAGANQRGGAGAVGSGWQWNATEQRAESREELGELAASTSLKILLLPLPLPLWFSFSDSDSESGWRRHADLKSNTSAHNAKAPAKGEVSYSSKVLLFSRLREFDSEQLNY